MRLFDRICLKHCLVFISTDVVAGMWLALESLPLFWNVLVRGAESNSSFFLHALRSLVTMHVHEGRKSEIGLLTQFHSTPTMCAAFHLPV